MHMRFANKVLKIGPSRPSSARATVFTASPGFRFGWANPAPLVGWKAMEIAGKRVLLTGATGGLGRSIAANLAAFGAKLSLSARSAGALEELSAGLPGSGHTVLPADFSREGEAVGLASAAGEVDILVANAALPATGRLDELTAEQVSRMVRVNLESPILLAQALVPGMVHRGRGKVVLIGSLAGKAGSPRSSIYNATKFGLRGFAFGLASDLAGDPVSVTVVAPGFVRSAGMFAESGVEAPAVLGTTTPERVAETVRAAIGSDRLEMPVAPARARVMAHLGLASPSLSHRVQSGKAGQDATARLAAGQVNKR